MRVGIAFVAIMIVCTPAAAQHIRVIDGDSVERNGEEWRVYGIDAPELPPRAKCEKEKLLALKAKERLQMLIAAHGARLIRVGREKYGRTLGRIIIGWPSTGEESWADIALREGLAVRYFGRGKRQDWCN